MYVHLFLPQNLVSLVATLVTCYLLRLDDKRLALYPAVSMNCSEASTQQKEQIQSNQIKIVNTKGLSLRNKENNRAHLISPGWQHRSRYLFGLLQWWTRMATLQLTSTAKGTAGGAYIAAYDNSQIGHCIVNLQKYVDMSKQSILYQLDKILQFSKLLFL